MTRANEFILSTDRLYLREFNTNDAPALFELNKDPIVLQFTGDDPFTSIEDAAEFILEYDAYRQWGYGRWAVLTKDKDQFIGWCGLKYHPDTQETDVGFRLLRFHWNKGYASEAAEECLRFGFEEKQLNKIIGRCHTKNQASMRVLEKLGMSFALSIEENGESWLQYEIASKAYSFRKGLSK